MPSRVIMRRPWDGRHIVRMEAITGLCWWSDSCHWQSCSGTLQGLVLVLAIKLKSEGSAEGGEGAFGGVGLCSLERNIMDFTGRCASAFASAMPFANSRYAID